MIDDQLAVTLLGKPYILVPCTTWQGNRLPGYDAFDVSGEPDADLDC